jgi:hypothetical protein
LGTYALTRMTGASVLPTGLPSPNYTSVCCEHPPWCVHHSPFIHRKFIRQSACRPLSFSAFSTGPRPSPQLVCPPNLAPRRATRPARPLSSFSHPPPQPLLLSIVGPFVVVPPFAPPSRPHRIRPLLLSLRPEADRQGIAALAVRSSLTGLGRLRGVITRPINSWPLKATV